MTGVVCWFTGLPSSGKSTLARAVAAKVPGAVLLDGDEVRAALRPSPGYDEAARSAFYETLARLAATLAAQGHVVLVPATAHRRAFRDLARQLAPRFVEVFLDTSMGECRARDAKGLFARDIAQLPGVGVPYEAPESPDVVVRPEDTDGVERVLTALR